jgi:23S rRNA (uracil1939-C5)-methyltransferase
MGDALYARWKRDLVVAALDRQRLTPVVDPLVRVGPQSRRRASFAILRPPGGRCRVGFHARASHRMVALEACAVLTPRIEAARAALDELAALLNGATAETRLAVADLAHGLDVDVQGAKVDLGGAMRGRLGALARAAGFARLSIDGEILVTVTPAILTCSDIDVPVPPGAFFQAVGAAETAIVGALEAGLPKRTKRIADLFAGIGTLALPLARRAPVLAVDSDATALQALAAATRHAQGLKPIETRARDLMSEPLSAKELEAFDVVVLDPPRAGARAQVERLAKSKVARVIMVSCAAATFARDARSLVDGGYRLVRVTPVDQFIWSAHVEMIGVFGR